MSNPIIDVLFLKMKVDRCKKIDYNTNRWHIIIIDHSWLLIFGSISFIFMWKNCEYDTRYNSAVKLLIIDDNYWSLNIIQYHWWLSFINYYHDLSKSLFEMAYQRKSNLYRRCHSEVMWRKMQGRHYVFKIKFVGLGYCSFSTKRSANHCS